MSTSTVPKGQRVRNRPIVYFHGGGFVLGDAETYDMHSRALAHLTQAVVVFVGYRLRRNIRSRPPWKTRQMRWSGWRDAPKPSVSIRTGSF